MSPIRDAVLVLTQEVDPTADVVHKRLLDLGIETVRFDTAAFPDRARLSTSFSEEGSRSVLVTDDAEVDLGSLRSIWYRRPSAFAFRAGMTEETQIFAREESRQALSGALHSSPAHWVNPPGAEARAALKPLQLRVARSLGLEVPETLITNDPRAARAFLSIDAAETIYKRLSSMLLFTDDGRLTAFQTEVVDDTAKARLDHVAVAPCLFQRYVPKAYEIRATVVERQIFAAKIDSQSSQLDSGRRDWRVANDVTTWEPYSLPRPVADRLITLVDSLGLCFGAIDLIRRPDGGYVFLEVNPNGQWAWFDDEITFAIRDAIIGALALRRTPSNRLVSDPV